MAVWKFRLRLPEGPPGTLFHVDIPLGSTILRVGEQGPAEFYLWALVGLASNELQGMERRTVLAVGTGHEFTAEPLKDIGLIAAGQNKADLFAHQETVLAIGGRLVIHFWISHGVALDGSA